MIPENSRIDFKYIANFTAVLSELQNVNQCRGRLHTIDDQVVLTVGEHNHEPSHLAGEVIASRTKTNDAAKQTGHSTHDIVADCVSRLSDHAVSTLPNLQHIKRTVQRIRQRHKNLLSLPTNRDSLLIDTQHIKTARGRTFLQFDSGLIDQRILIFSTKKQLKMFKNANSIYLDGILDLFNLSRVYQKVYERVDGPLQLAQGFIK
ncbi:unnamed protein product, partial [Rotaria sp. Silwood1]